MKEEIQLPDKELFANHLRTMNDSIFAFNRAIEVLERESMQNPENKIVLITVIDSLKAHVSFKKQLQIEGKQFLEKELSQENKKESD